MCTIHLCTIHQRLSLYKTILLLLSLFMVSGCKSDPTGANPASNSIKVNAILSTFPANQIDEGPSQSTNDSIDHERAVASIMEFTNSYGTDLSFKEITIMINSPNADRYVAIYQDGLGAMYSVDPMNYLVVQIDPSPIRLQVGDPIPVDKIRQIAQDIASSSPGFIHLESTLQYEEGQKGNIFFFTWTDPRQDWKYNRPFLQMGIQEDGTLLTYINTLFWGQ